MAEHAVALFAEKYDPDDRMSRPKLWEEISDNFRNKEGEIHSAVSPYPFHALYNAP